jgi:genome maintenance exonuclease 1
MFNYCPPVDLQDLQSTTLPDGQRYYMLPDGTRLPSVTTVLGAQKKQSILEWRKRVGEEEANKISKKASGRGTSVHTMCEHYLNNKSDYTKDKMPDAIEMFLSIKSELDKINNIWYQEQSLYSKKVGMAGRVDCIGEYEGKLSIIDFKTSSKIKKKENITDYFSQCCAYSLMLQDMINIEINQLVIIMAVENENPLVFVEKTRDHIPSLVESIKFYRNNSGKNK